MLLDFIFCHTSTHVAGLTLPLVDAFHNLLLLQEAGLVIAQAFQSSYGV